MRGSRTTGQQATIVHAPDPAGIRFLEQKIRKFSITSSLLSRRQAKRSLGGERKIMAWGRS
jgi:hypothetical protein